MMQGLADLMLLLPGFLAGLLVLSTHVPLGRQVLQRGIIFIDLAIAQLAGLGVIAVHVVFDEPGFWAVQVAALAAALLGAVGLHWSERRWPAIQEAVIGAVFVLAVATALLLLANDPHGGERLKELLAGQLLWVRYEDLVLPALMSALILLVWWRGDVGRRPLLFYALFAVAVTQSVQLVGVYLVFASLIIPALAIRARPGPGLGWVIGAVGYVLGLLASLWLDLPTGPVIVWCLALTAVGFRLSAAAAGNETSR